MSIEIQNVQRLRAYVEPDGSLGVDHSGTMGDFIDIPAIEGTITPLTDEESLPTNTVKQSKDDYSIEARGKLTCKLSFDMFLAGTGVAANASTSAVQGPLGLLLKTVMGGESLAMGSAVATDTSATVIDVTATQGSRFSAGTAIAIPFSGAMQARELKTVATDTLTTKIAFTGTPAVAAVVYRAATYYLTENPLTSLQFVLEGAGASDRWSMRGMQCTSIRFNVVPGQLPTVSFEFTGTAWSNLGAGTLAVGSVTNSVPFAVQDSQLLVQTVGTSTYSGAEVHASAIELTPNIAYVPATSPGGSETVYRWVRTRNAPTISGSFTTFFEDLAWYTARDNRTTKNVALQIGNAVPSSTLGTVLVTAPRVQILNVQRVADGVGIAGQQVSWKGMIDSDATDQTTELRKSAFRIHLW
jgi:hypothetical protein